MAILNDKTKFVLQGMNIAGQVIILDAEIKINSMCCQSLTWYFSWVHLGVLLIEQYPDIQYIFGPPSCKITDNFPCYLYNTNSK